MIHFLIKKGLISQTIIERDAQFQHKFDLFDYLNCTLRTLGFTSSADQTFTDFGRLGFTRFDFVDAYRASVYASFASGAFGVNNYFYHFCLPLIFSEKLLSKIKGFRFFNVISHVILVEFHSKSIQLYPCVSGILRCFSCRFLKKFRLCFGQIQVF